MNGLNDMNEFKQAWMEEVYLSLPTLITRMDDSGQPRSSGLAHEIGNSFRLRLAIRVTQKAAATGLAIATLDGPIPIMDVVGFTFFVAASGGAWYNFFDNL